MHSLIKWNVHRMGQVHADWEIWQFSKMYITTKKLAIDCRINEYIFQFDPYTHYDEYWYNSINSTNIIIYVHRLSWLRTILRTNCMYLNMAWSVESFQGAMHDSDKNFKRRRIHKRAAECVQVYIRIHCYVHT